VRNASIVSRRCPGRKFCGDGAVYSPALFHNSSTRFFTSGVISITPGHGRVKPSVAHLRVASIPIFEPKFGRRLE